MARLFHGETNVKSLGFNIKQNPTYCTYGIYELLSMKVTEMGKNTCGKMNKKLFSHRSLKKKEKQDQTLPEVSISEELSPGFIYTGTES